MQDGYICIYIGSYKKKNKIRWFYFPTTESIILIQSVKHHTNEYQRPLNFKKKKKRCAISHFNVVFLRCIYICAVEELR